MEQYFDKFIKAAPQRTYSIINGLPSSDTQVSYKGNIEEIISELNLEAEINQLRLKLFDINTPDRFLFVEQILRPLIDTYYSIREGMSSIPENQNLQRKLMNKIYDAMTGIIILLNGLKISIPDEFLSEFQRRDKTGLVFDLLDLFRAKEPKNQLGYEWTPKQLKNIAEKLKTLNRISDAKEFIAIVSGTKIGTIDWKYKSKDDFKSFIFRFLKMLDYGKKGLPSKNKKRLPLALITKMFTINGNPYSHGTFRPVVHSDFDKMFKYVGSIK